MTFVLAWVAFPVVLAVVGLGWGVLVEEVAGTSLPSGALLIPVGMAAALVVAALLTTSSVTARLAVPVVGLVALAGLVRARQVSWGWPVPKWSLAAAAIAMLAYGAPVLATGTPTFAGFEKLDDTATWLAITAHMFADGRSVVGLPPSSYKVVLDSYLNAGAYPIGSFMLLGIGGGLARVGVVWAYQPYLACAGAALALCLYALSEPVVASPRLRAVVAAIAAQPALLYAYSLWGGIKEMTAAFLVALIAALAVPLLRRRPEDVRAVAPLAVATAALIVTFGPGTAVWVVPGLGAVAAVWLVTALRGRDVVRGVARSVGTLAAGGVVLSVPVWLTLSASLRTDAVFASAAGAASTPLRLGNLRAPLGVVRLAGIWPSGDFRDPLPSGLLPVLLIAVVLAAALAGIWVSVRARHAGAVVYAAIALGGCAAIYVGGGVPWVVGKALAIASPALPFAGLLGGALLWKRSRVGGGAVIGLIVAGVVWSNALGYHDATVAPVGRLDDLAHIGRLISGEGPTFVDDYMVYADRYFLRDAQPVEPGELGSTPPLADGMELVKPAEADLDSFPAATLLRYRSIVTTSSPTESRPPSVYRLLWAGRYYEVWQRAVHPTVEVLEHIPYGDSTTIPYCGAATNRDGTSAPTKPVCSIEPAATATCRQVRSIAAYASSHDGELVAAERPANSDVRGNGLTRPSSWGVTPAAQTITALSTGTASVQIDVSKPGGYALWLGGSFAAGGFRVSLDGLERGQVQNDLSLVLGYAPVADFELTPGAHTITLTHPGSSLAPGSGGYALTTLASVVLEPDPGSARLATVSPENATSLCGKTVDWIEVTSSKPL